LYISREKSRENSHRVLFVYADKRAVASFQLRSQSLHIGSFEPVVMFFGLTNSPATFQTMMNDIFCDLINKGDIVTFIDNVLVGIEIEEVGGELS